VETDLTLTEKQVMATAMAVRSTLQGFYINAAKCCGHHRALQSDHIDTLMGVLDEIERKRPDISIKSAALFTQILDAEREDEARK
jgi:hypothetical protein